MNQFKLRRSLQSSSNSTKEEDGSESQQTKNKVDNHTVQKLRFDTFLESTRKIENDKTIKLLHTKIDQIFLQQETILKEVKFNQTLLNDILGQQWQHRQQPLSRTDNTVESNKVDDLDQQSILSITTQDDDADEVSVTAYLKKRRLCETIQKKGK